MVNKSIKLYIFTFLFLGLYIPSSNAEIDSKLNLIVELVATLNLNDDVDYGIQGAILGRKICKAGGGIYCSTTQTIGEGICKAGGGNYCSTTRSIGEGICKAGGGNYCSTTSNIGEGICKAGGGNYCSTTKTIGEGICKARGYSSCSTIMSAKEALSLPVKDTNWKWDKFINPNTYGNVWACRGTATGKFAEDYKCFDELKTDDTWPNN